MNSPRIAWLLTSAFYYWHPMLSCLTQRFPHTTAFAGKWRGYAPGFENSFTVEVVGDRKVVSLTKDSTGYGSSFTYLSLNIVNRLLRFKPDVIFSNSFGMWTVLALLLKPLGRWRVVIAYEGSSPSVDYRNSPMRIAMRRSMVRASDACITNSQTGEAYLIEILKAQKNHVFRQPYEVPAVESLSKSSSTLELDNSSLKHPIFLFVGGIIPRKGLQLLLEACAILQSKECCDYTLQIVGAGSQQAELEAFVENHSLHDRVVWVGRVDYGCLGTYFREADVFVLPTLEDTWGVVILEAMALGKAILCSKWAGAAEMVIDGENGYCFDPQDPGRLAEFMARFIQDPDLSTAMGKKSQELSVQNTPEAAAEFLATVTQFVLSSEIDK